MRSRRIDADRRGWHLPVAVFVPLAWLCVLAPRVAAAEIIDRVVAVVDGQVITLSDATAALQFGFVEPQEGADPLRSAIDQLIERQLMLIEVERYGPPEPPAAAIDRAAAAVRARFESASRLATALAQSGMAEDQLRRRLRDDLRIRAYLDQRFAAAGQTADPERRRAVIRDWLAGLRRRADVTVLYEPPVSR
jgi:parvulin-like peptidyl-prolyl isomerase